MNTKTIRIPWWDRGTGYLTGSPQHGEAGDKALQTFARTIQEELEPAMAEANRNAMLNAEYQETVRVLRERLDTNSKKPPI